LNHAVETTTAADGSGNEATPDRNGRKNFSHQPALFSSGLAEMRKLLTADRTHFGIDHAPRSLSNDPRHAVERIRIGYSGMSEVVSASPHPSRTDNRCTAVAKKNGRTRRPSGSARTRPQWSSFSSTSA
jgi:hypothetical protein